jgi:hypothetical protein
MTIGELNCFDTLGRQNIFCYSLTQTGDKWFFRVRPKGASPTSDFFELTVEEVDSSCVRVIMMHNHGYAPVKAKGIPDALIPEIRRVLGREVQSSPTLGSSHDVRRSCSLRRDD